MEFGQIKDISAASPLTVICNTLSSAYEARESCTIHLPESAVALFSQLRQPVGGSDQLELVSVIPPRKQKSKIHKLANKWTKLLFSICCIPVVRRETASWMVVYKPIGTENASPLELCEKNGQPLDLPSHCQEMDYSNETSISELPDAHDIKSQATSLVIPSNATLPAGPYPASSESHSRSISLNRSPVHSNVDDVNVDSSTHIEPGRLSCVATVPIKNFNRAHVTPLNSQISELPSAPLIEYHSTTDTNNGIPNLGMNASTNVRMLQRLDRQRTYGFELSRPESFAQNQSYNHTESPFINSDPMPTAPRFPPAGRLQQVSHNALSNDMMIGMTNPTELSADCLARSIMPTQRQSNDTQNSQAMPPDSVNWEQNSRQNLEQIVETTSPSVRYNYPLSPKDSNKANKAHKPGVIEDDQFSLLLSHYKVDAGKNVFQCSCGTTFHSEPRVARSNLNRHIRSDRTILFCGNGCGKTFKRSDNRKSHHSVCRSSSTSLDSFKNHSASNGSFF